MKTKFLKWQLVITIGIFLIVIFSFYYFENKNLKAYPDDVLSFNINSGFYDKEIDIEIKKSFSLPFGTKLYYTLDGNDPSNESNLYTGKISLSLDEKNLKVYPLKVVAYYKGNYSEIYNETYILDKEIKENDITLISITSDEKNLYDYDKGILVKGANDNYYQRSDDWLRDAHIAIFSEKGENLLSQNILLGVSGGSNSSENPKSFKIKAINEEKLNLNFYDEDYKASFSLINNYNSLRLRSGSQDLKTGNIRSGIISQLASDSNFDGASISKRAVVFLNGEFYGIHDIEQNYSNSFLAKKYSLPNSDLIEKYKGKDITTTVDAKIIQYFYQDLNMEQNRQELEKYVDMDSYLFYYAIEILANNIDWPNNNFEIWRYTGEYNPNNKYTDGRYRFLIYDVDAIFSGDIHIGDLGDDYRDVLMLIMNNMYNQQNTSFVQVMKSTYYRNKFVRIVEDLLNTSFSRENMLKIADEEANKINKAVSTYYTKEEKNNFLYHVEYIKENMENRKKEIENDFNQLFALKEKHKINIASTTGMKIYWNNVELLQNEQYENEYYTDIKLDFHYEEYPGYKFQYWLVNGKKIYDKDLIIDNNYKNKNVEIKIVTEYVPDINHLIISEIYSNGSYDWIKITNTGKNEINLKNYFLSDNINKLDKYRLPDVILKSNQSIIINGSKNYYALGDYISNFNLKEYEYLYLTYNDQICDSLQVPRTSSIETYGRVDNSNTFKFFINYNNLRKNNT